MRWVVLSLVFTVGCVENDAVEIPLDFDYYRCNVQPIVDRSCSALACHGDARRPFHTYTRNRLRLVGTSTERDLPITAEELMANFENSALFTDIESPRDSWILRKGLAEAADGYFHRGQEYFGGADVFENTSDPDYQTILRWVQGDTSPATCVYRGGG